MKISKVKTSITVALMKSVSNENFKTKDIEKQLAIVRDYLINNFLESCQKEAEECLKDDEKFDLIMSKFEKIGPKFTTHIIGD